MASQSFPTLSILAVLLALLLSHNLYAASAASGGRMGGSSFSSDTSSSSSQYDHHRYHDSFGVYGYNSWPIFSRNSNQENDSQPSFSGNSNQENDFMIYVVIMICVGATLFMVFLCIVGDRISVLQVQVGLSAKAHSLQRELSKIALTTDSSNANNWNFILKETISSLLHHPKYYLYGYSSVKRCLTTEDAEQCFKQLSKEERLNFDVESLVNINNTKRHRAIVPKADEVNRDCIVVTVLVATEGVTHNLPTIRTSDDVKEALQSLTKICSSQIKGVEVLWSPQDETDSLSVEELLENYPQLRKI